MFKTLAFSLSLILFVHAQSLQAQTATPIAGSILPVVQQHKQIYDMSCIPSSVEMVLKYYKKVRPDYYDLQEAWKNKMDGTFHNFDGQTIDGIKFTHRFNLPRNDRFPIDSLFKTIDAELKAGRKVILSLPSGGGMWHIYIVDHLTDTGDYWVYSRGLNDPNVLEMRNVREFIKAIQGTDILTYTLTK